MSSQILLPLALFLLLLLSFKSSSSSPLPHSLPSFHIGSRSILRTIISGTADLPHDSTVDLNATSFDAVLGATPASHALVEFFAHWCPACRNYKPHYDKVARLFNGPDAAHPGIILVARVDCALKINNKLCDMFSVNHYPMLFWSQPANFLSGSLEGKGKIKMLGIDDGRTADRLLNWINKQIRSSYGLDDAKFENENLSSNVSDPPQIARAIYDVEEATSAAFDIILERKMIKSETRGSLLRFLQLLVAHHPSERCRQGSADILVDFNELWPSDAQESVMNKGNGTLRNFQVCGKEIPLGYWMFCRGSKNDTRGFSCGLWVLLHSLSVRVDDGESQLAFSTICDFIHNFFICEECRQHFYEMCTSVSNHFNKTRDFALWLWSVHNKVNERLMKEEESLRTGDPKFPKIIWPSKKLCSSCHSSLGWKRDANNQIEWDMDEVFKFLVTTYGKMLVSVYKDKKHLMDGQPGVGEDMVVSANAVAVPLGAALAIAVSSCTFGALACFWRTQQKNRKYLRHLHSLKNI